MTETCTVYSHGKSYEGIMTTDARFLDALQRLAVQGVDYHFEELETHLKSNKDVRKAAANIQRATGATSPKLLAVVTQRPWSIMGRCLHGC